MCGVAGYVTSTEDNDPSRFLRPLADAMRHRGPDDEGYFQEPGVGLAVRRLSIVDLVCGGQPISNEDGTIHVVFNGEIYNYIELRTDLEKRGHRLGTGSDTATLDHLYEEHGEEILRILRGMFALAPLLDQRLGVREIGSGGLGAYLIFGFISAPQTIVKQIKKLPPAHCLVWQAGEVKVQRYWSFDQSEKLVCSYNEALGLVREKLDESIRLRLRSDVPVGLLLSGGLDSNTLLARLVRGLGQKVKAFTIGFTQKEYDESEIAQKSARHFRSEEHTSELQ